MSEIRTKEEIINMQNELQKKWKERIYKDKKGNLSEWIALSYTIHTLDYVLGKLKAPPVLGLISEKNE